MQSASRNYSPNAILLSQTLVSGGGAHLTGLLAQVQSSRLEEALSMLFSILYNKLTLHFSLPEESDQP